MRFVSGAFITAIAVVFLLNLPATSAFAAGDIGWKKLVTRYTIIQYHDKSDLLKFDKNIRWSSEKWGFKSFMASSNPQARNKKLIEKIDALFQRVQEILDMRKRVKRVIIKIYPNKRELDNVHHRLVMQNGHARAWYLFHYQTIYLNVRDLHEGILAHEMGHHIVDHYFGVRPPAASAEILCRYVDQHLHD